MCAITLCLGAGLIGFGLKFLTYINPGWNPNEWFYVILPPWPNYFDVLFLCTAGVFLLILGVDSFLSKR